MGLWWFYTVLVPSFRHHSTFSLFFCIFAVHTLLTLKRLSFCMSGWLSFVFYTISVQLCCTFSVFFSYFLYIPFTFFCVVIFCVFGLLQVASKTNDAAGDGTTAATVLTRAIFREGCKVRNFQHNTVYYYIVQNSTCPNYIIPGTIQWDYIKVQLSPTCGTLLGMDDFGFCCIVVSHDRCLNFVDPHLKVDTLRPSPTGGTSQYVDVGD